MKTLHSLVLATLLFASFATPGMAKSIWQEIQDSAPLQPFFETLRDNAP